MLYATIICSKECFSSFHSCVVITQLHNVNITIYNYAINLQHAVTVQVPLIYTFFRFFCCCYTVSVTYKSSCCISTGSAATFFVLIFVYFIWGFLVALYNYVLISHPRSFFVHFLLEMFLGAPWKKSSETAKSKRMLRTWNILLWSLILFSFTWNMNLDPLASILLVPFDKSNLVV